MNETDQIKFANFVLQQQQNLLSAIERNSGYLARQEIEFLIAKCRVDPKRLEQYGFKVYSQSDEDGIFQEVFRRLGIKTGVFCEIGVENGLECNTLFLIHQGWRGIWLEGNPQQQQQIESKFSSILKNKRLGLGIGMITPSNINQTIERVFLPLGIDSNDVDFLSIDVDGMDIYLMQALQFQPKVICIEYNAKFPPPVAKKPVFDENYRWQGLGSDYMGSSLTAIAQTANAKDYSLVGTSIVGGNAFFVRNDLISDHFCRDMSPEALYNPPRYYLYDNHFRLCIGHSADFGPYTDLV